MEKNLEATPLTARPIIDAVNGRRTLLKYWFEFDHNGGPHLSEWGEDVADKPTGETRTVVLEYGENLTFAGMFRMLARDLSSLCLTKNQIGEFLECHNSFLRRDAPAFLLFKNNGHFFIVKAVRVGIVSVRIKIFHFEDLCEWLGRLSPRIIVPV